MAKLGFLKQVGFEDAIYRANVDCRVSDEFQEIADEIFLPLWL